MYAFSVFHLCVTYPGPTFTSSSASVRAQRAVWEFQAQKTF